MAIFLKEMGQRQEVDNNATLLTIFNATLLYLFIDFKLSKNFDFLFQSLWQNNIAKGQKLSKANYHLVLISSKKRTKSFLNSALATYKGKTTYFVRFRKIWEQGT